MRRLRIPDAVAGLIPGLHQDLKRKIRSALDNLLDDSTIGTSIREELAGLRSCRVGRFRIIYRVAGTVIEVVAVGLRHVLSGQTNKQIAASLGTAEKTVKIQRGRVRQKMQAAASTGSFRSSDLRRIDRSTSINRFGEDSPILVTVP